MNMLDYCIKEILAMKRVV